MADHRPATVSRPELLIQGNDSEFRVFLHSFMAFSRCLEGVRSYLAQRVGVSPPQYEILSHLREHSHDGGLTVNEAAERLHCSGAFVTTEAGKLHRAGLVKRARDPKDARRVRLTISPICEKRFRSVAPVQRMLNDALFASLGAREFQVLREVFPRLADDGDRAVALAEFLAKSQAGKQA
jgi:MarR family transcriptional regulator, organic hydroperoxide resistance regulator